MMKFIKFMLVLFGLWGIRKHNENIRLREKVDVLERQNHNFSKQLSNSHYQLGKAVSKLTRK